MAPEVVISPTRKATSQRKAPAAGGPQVGEELAKVQYEPFEPVERKLIAWSLGLGVVLLVVLVWVSYTFFTG
jgi:hypothetical protein